MTSYGIFDKATFKKIALLKPRAGLGTEQFTRYWRNTHGPLVANAPGYAAYRRRYVQNHILEQAPVGKSLDYSGMAEFWLPGPNESDYARTPTYLDHIRPDEEKFIDMDRTLSMTARELRLARGGGEVKLVVFHRRKQGLEAAEFARHWKEWARSRVEADANEMSGLTINLVEEGTTVSPGDRKAEPLPIDCMLCCWFDGVETLHRVIDSPRFRRTILLEEAPFIEAVDTRSFVAEELIYFDGGMATALASRPS